MGENNANIMFAQCVSIMRKLLERLNPQKWYKWEKRNWKDNYLPGIDLPKHSFFYGFSTIDSVSSFKITFLLVCRKKDDELLDLERQDHLFYFGVEDLLNRFDKKKVLEISIDMAGRELYDLAIQMFEKLSVDNFGESKEHVEGTVVFLQKLEKMF